MLQIRAKVLYNKRVKDNYFRLILKDSKIARESVPGQFLNIKVSGTYEPLLRRPFSIHRTKEDNLEILYEVVGKGTEILSQKKAGEILDVIGPLGNGFSILNSQYSILVCGGMGVAPLLFLAKELTQRKTQNAKRKTLILIGAKTRNQILCEREFKELSCDVRISTDDGSQGFRGKVTELLKNVLFKNSTNSKQLKNSIYACGPKPMLKEISRISQKYKIPAQVSLEEHMACGIGACFGCVVNTREGYKRVCKDGPVFNAQEIIWE